MEAIQMERDLHRRRQENQRTTHVLFGCLLGVLGCLLGVLTATGYNLFFQRRGNIGAVPIPESRSVQSPAGWWHLEMILSSAKELDFGGSNDCNLYATVFFDTNPPSLQSTPADTEGGRNPTWNSTKLYFSVWNDGSDHLRSRTLSFVLRCEGSGLLAGEGKVSIGDLLNNIGDELLHNGGYRSFGCLVLSGEGKPRGLLSFDYKIKDFFGEEPSDGSPSTAAGAPVPHPRPPSRWSLFGLVRGCLGVCLKMTRLITRFTTLLLVMKLAITLSLDNLPNLHDIKWLLWSLVLLITKIV